MFFFSNFSAAADELEPRYRAHYLAADARQTSVAIAVWMIPVLLFAYGDYMLFGPSPRFAVSLALRLTFCGFSLYTIYALTKVATARDYERVFLCWAAVGAAAVLYLNYTWARHVPPNGAITILIIFSSYMVFPNRLSVRLAPPLALSAGNFLLQWGLDDPVEAKALFTMLVALLMANILGIVFSTWLLDRRRAEFKSRLEEARIKEELGRLAATDELTGAFNRRKLMELAAEEFGRFRGGGRTLSVLMMDINHFKKLNDRYGHEAGDRVLADFTAYVARNLRAREIWGRLGGDEFVLVLPEAAGHQAEAVGERLRLGLKEPVVWHGEELAYTISIGVTEAREKDGSIDAVLKRADKALYAAKRGGRNRTELA